MFHGRFAAGAWRFALNAGTIAVMKVRVEYCSR
jgi:hypothetical protein